MMAAVDEGVGMLLEALERSRVLDNTCIFFLGDNG
jgi:arylsulfatase A-like enzyme